MPGYLPGVVAALRGQGYADSRRMRDGSQVNHKSAVLRMWLVSGWLALRT